MAANGLRLNLYYFTLTFSWWRSLSNRNQSIDYYSKAKPGNLIRSPKTLRNLSARKLIKIIKRHCMRPMSRTYIVDHYFLEIFCRSENAKQPWFSEVCWGNHFQTILSTFKQIFTKEIGALDEQNHKPVIIFSPRVNAKQSYVKKVRFMNQTSSAFFNGFTLQFSVCPRTQPSHLWQNNYLEKIKLCLCTGKPQRKLLISE